MKTRKQEKAERQRTQAGKTGLPFAPSTGRIKTGKAIIQIEEQKKKIQELEEQLDFVYDFFAPATKYKYIKAQNGNWYRIDKDDRDWNHGCYFWQTPDHLGLWTKFIEKGEK